MSRTLKPFDPTSVKLTEHQAQVVGVWGEGLAVLAGAGSGKTTTLVMKCLELVRRNPEARFAAVSFTERSAADLKRKLTDGLGHPPEARGHLVGTIHGLCGAIVREFPRAAQIDGEERIADEVESQALWRRACDSLWAESLAEDLRADVGLVLNYADPLEASKIIRRLFEVGRLGGGPWIEQKLTPSVMGDIEDQATPLAAFCRLSRAVGERYQRLKSRAGVMDFSDLEVTARRAVEDSTVRRRIAERYELFMVDEFQDTNLIQSEIIWSCLKPHQTNLVIVGDPKQSIYRFRDADVTLFEELCAKLPRQLTLSRNFRSVPAVVDWTNSVCAPLFEASQLSYHPLEAAREADTEPSEPVQMLRVDSPERFAVHMAALKAGGAKLEEHVLLLRQVRGAESWLDALVERGVPISIESGGLFFADVRVRELVAFLEWWFQPEQKLSGLEALRAPWVAVEDSVIDSMWRTGGSLKALFLRLDHPLAMHLRDIEHARIRAGELLKRLLELPHIERHVGSQCLGLWHRAEELSRKGLDADQSVRELRRCVEEGRRSGSVPPPEQSGVLRVLTIHGSKGLEFPHVWMVEFSPKRKINRRLGKTRLFADRRQGIYLVPYPDGARAKKEDAPELEQWSRREADAELAETKRLFYVAITRAEKSLTLVFCGEDPPPKEPAKGKPLKEEDPLTLDFWRKWVEFTRRPTETEPLQAQSTSPRDRVRLRTENTEENENTLKAVAIRHTPAPRKRARHSVTAWATLNRCEACYARALKRRDSIEVTLAESSEETPKLEAREIGTRVHAALDQYSKHSRSSAPEEAMSRLQESLRALAKEAGEHRFSADTLLQWVSRSELMMPGSPAVTELSFDIQIAGEGLVGAIDRLLLPTGHTPARLIDFKVVGDRVTDQELEIRYGAQMALYAEAVSRLEPEFVENLECWLVVIAPGAVRELRLSSVASGAALREQVERMAKRARDLIAVEGAGAKGLEGCKDCGREAGKD